MNYPGFGASEHRVYEPSEESITASMSKASNAMVSAISKHLQVVANNLSQMVDYGGGDVEPIVSMQMLFDRSPMAARPAPEFGEHSDEGLVRLGYGEEALIDLKVEGIVF